MKQGPNHLARRNSMWASRLERLVRVGVDDESPADDVRLPATLDGWVGARGPFDRFR